MCSTLTSHVHTHADTCICTHLTLIYAHTHMCTLTYMHTPARSTPVSTHALASQNHASTHAPISMHTRTHAHTHMHTLTQCVPHPYTFTQVHMLKTHVRALTHMLGELPPPPGNRRASTPTAPGFSHKSRARSRSPRNPAISETATYSQQTPVASPSRARAPSALCHRLRPPLLFMEQSRNPI